MALVATGRGAWLAVQAAVAASAPLAFAGCLFDVGLPLGADVRCAADADCPGTHRCSAELVGRCVDRAPADRAPPAVLAASVTLSPARASPGTEVLVSFSVDEELGVPPVVEMDVGGDVVRFEPRGDGSLASRAFAYARRLAPGTPEGPAAIVATLVDVSGNEAAGAALGVLEVDATPPRLSTAPVVSPERAGPGTTVTVEVDASEPLGVAPVPVLESAAGVAGWSVVELAPATRFRLSAPADAFAEGGWALELELVDAAGNGARVEAGSVVVDRTAPTLAGDVEVVPARAAPGVSVLVSVPLSGDALPSASLTAVCPAALPFELLGSSAGALRFRRIVGAADNADCRLVLTGLGDAAGNVAAALDVGDVVFDNVPPAVVGYAQQPPRASLGQQITVSFSTSEPLADPPTVRLGGIELSPVNNAEPWGFAAVLTAAMLPTGVGAPEVRLVDDAGNGAVFIGEPVIVDADPPGLVSVSFSPTVLTPGGAAALSIVTDEPLGPAPSLTWSGTSPATTLLDSSGLLHTFRVDPGADPGPFVLSGIGLVDHAGNAAAVAVDATLTVDATVPVIAPLTANASRFSAVAPFNALALRFELSEALGLGDVAAQLGDLPLVCTSAVPTTGAVAFSCDHVVTPASGAEGPVALIATARDSVGNVVAANTFVTLDFTAPAVVSGTEVLRLTNVAGNAASVATVGTSVQLVFLGDDLLVAPPVADVSPLVMTFAPTASGLTWSLVGTLTDGQHDGTHQPRIVLVDAVANQRTVSFPATFVADTSPEVFAPLPGVLATLDLNGDARDGSGAGRDGVLLGGSFSTSAFGQALDMRTPVDPVGVDWSAHAALLVPPYTIELVVRVIDGDGFQKLVGFKDDRDAGWYVFGTQLIAVESNGNFGGLATVVLTLNRQQHIALVANSTDEHDVFLDGVLRGTFVASLNTGPASGGLVLFRDDTTTQREERFSGTADAVRFSSVARTPEEIAATAARVGLR